MNDKRSDRALWEALEDQRAADDLDELLAMSDEELDRSIDEEGGDSKAIRAAGAALVEELFARRARLAWHDEMEQKLEAFRKTAAASRSTEKLPRAELLGRLAAFRQNPRFGAQVAIMFQKKSAEASTDEELQADLEALQLLAKLEEE
jgi:hypothetical protein